MYLGKLNGSHLSAVHMALSAVNLAECAGSCLPVASLAEVYVSAALRVKASLPRILHFTSVRPWSFYTHSCLVQSFIICRCNILFYSSCSLLTASVSEQRPPGLPVSQWQRASSDAVALSPTRSPLLCGWRLGYPQHSQRKHLQPGGQHWSVRSTHSL